MYFSIWNINFVIMIQTKKCFLLTYGLIHLWIVFSKIFTSAQSKTTLNNEILFCNWEEDQLSWWSMWPELEISQLHNDPLEESSDHRVTTIFQFLFSLSSTTWRRLPEGGAFCKLALMQSKLFSTLPKQCLFQLSEACILIQWGVFYTVIVCKTVICRQVKCTKIMSCLWCTLISETGTKILDRSSGTAP